MHTQFDTEGMIVMEETMSSTISNAGAACFGINGNNNNEEEEVQQLQHSGSSFTNMPTTDGNTSDSGGKLLAEVTSSGIPAFPWRLHDMLDDAPRKNFESIVSWQMGGRAFKVHDTKLFVSTIMPNYFNQSHYKSFQRQLNIYGFQRMTHGKDKGAYTHELLVQGNSDLCRYMIRVKIKNKGSKTSSTNSLSGGSSHGENNSRRGIGGRGIARNRSCPQTLQRLQQALKSGSQEELRNNVPQQNSSFLDCGYEELAPSSGLLGRGQQQHGHTRKRSLSLGCILDFDTSKLSYASLQQQSEGGSSINQTWQQLSLLSNNNSSSSSNTNNNLRSLLMNNNTMNSNTSLFASVLQNSPHNNNHSATLDALLGKTSSSASSSNKNPMMNSRTTAAMLQSMMRNQQSGNNNNSNSNVSMTAVSPFSSTSNDDDDIMLDIMDDFEDAPDVSQQLPASMEPTALPVQPMSVPSSISTINRSPFAVFNTTTTSSTGFPFKDLRRESLRPVGLNEMVDNIAPDVADEIARLFG